MSNRARSPLTLLSIAVLSLPCLSLPSPATANPNAESLTDAVQGGKAKLSLRARYESVDQTGIADTAEALTVRTRLSFETAPLGSFRALVEFDHLSAPIDDYNDTRNGKSNFPVVADPEGSGLNQAYLQFGGIENLPVKLGRQRINLDNQRFVGGVGFRQNEQTFDSLSVDGRGRDGFKPFYAYVSKVDRIFGPDNSAGQPADFQSESHLLNGKYGFGGVGALVGYLYELDFDSDEGAGAQALARRLSSRTAGARWEGKVRFADKLSLHYNGEFARQTDTGNNPNDYDANYLMFEGGLTGDVWQFTLGREILEGDANLTNASFQTPLATAHAFQGWADKWVLTPHTGLEDTYLKVVVKFAGTSLFLLLNDYQAEAGSGDYGDEVGLMWTVPFMKAYEFKLEYADYSAADPAPGVLGIVDTQKLWLTFSANW